MKVSVKMSGFKELVGSLSMFNVAGRKRLAQAVDRSSARIEAGAKARVPKLSGELEKSIRRKMAPSGMSAAIMAGHGEMARKGKATTARSKGQRVNQGKGVYAPAVEFGSVGKPAEPFLFPALHAESGAFAAACGTAMDQALGDAVKKGAK